MPHAEQTDAATDATKRISAAEAARMLGVTKDAVRYMVSRGELRPLVAGKGVQAWFDRGDVIAYAAKRQRRKPGRLTQGAIEAAAMVQFAAHHAAGTIARCVPDVVIATLLPAHEVIRLRDIYARERGITIPAALAPKRIEADEAREERHRETERSDFDRQIEERRRAIDRELGAESPEDEEDEGAERRQRRKSR